MTPIRWPALVLLGAAIAGLVVADQQFTVDTERDRIPLVLASEATDVESLSSTWYCPAGTLGEESIADHWVVVANPTAARISATLTIFPVTLPPAEPLQVEPGEDVNTDLVAPPPDAQPGAAVEKAVVVEPGERVEIRLGDVEGVTGDAAGALVEAVGGVVVEHRVAGTAGSASGPCASTAHSEWHVVGGTTRDGARQIIAIFNPFPQEAIVSLSFDTDSGPRAPSAYQSVTVRAGAVLPVDITDVVPLFENTSATVIARSGRVVVERLQVLADDGAGQSTSLMLGTPSAAPQWVFGATQLSAEVGTALVIHNTTTREARVDVEVHLDPYEGAPPLEPISVTIRPERTQTVVLSPLAYAVGTRAVVDAASRLPTDAPVAVTYWAAVRSLNGVPVVVSRIEGPGVDADGAPTGTGAVRWASASAISAREWVTTGGAASLVVVNPGAEAVAIATVVRRGPDGDVVVTEVEIGRGGRQVIDLGGFDLGGASVVVRSDELIVVEQGSTGGAYRPADPVRPTWEELDLPFAE